MERRKFLKGMAVLAVLPIVGVAKETYPLTVSFDSIPHEEAINKFGIREIDLTHLVPDHIFDMDANSMYAGIHAPISDSIRNV